MSLAYCQGYPNKTTRAPNVELHQKMPSTHIKKQKTSWKLHKKMQENSLHTFTKSYVPPNLTRACANHCASLAYSTDALGSPKPHKTHWIIKKLQKQEQYTPSWWLLQEKKLDAPFPVAQKSKLDSKKMQTFRYIHFPTVGTCLIASN